MDELDKSEEIAAIRILIVDDDLTFLMTLKKELSNRYKVMTAEDGIEAQLMLECRNDFDLIVSDQSMPVLNGIDLFAWVAKEYPQTPKVLLAELSELTDEIKSQTNEDKFYCLNKSLELNEIIAAIDQAIIGVKPAIKPLFKNSDDKIVTLNQATERKPSRCKMAVLDANTKNWSTFDKLTKQSELIGDVVYFRNPMLILERLKKDSSLGVVCINYSKNISATNDVIDRINRLKHTVNIILICSIDQASAAGEYQSKGKIYQRVIKPGPAAKVLVEIESAAEQFIADNQALKEAESHTSNPGANHIIKQSEERLTHAIQ